MAGKMQNASVTGLLVEEVLEGSGCKVEERETIVANVVAVALC